MRLALYQPEIAQNAGAAMRSAACFGAAVDIIEPCGFPLGERGLKRAAMDYPALVEISSHASWGAFLDSAPVQRGRLVLLSTKAVLTIWNHSFLHHDIVVVGQESAGAPPEVHDRCEAVISIPMAVGARSLNVATAASIALAEARRQLDVKAV